MQILADMIKNYFLPGSIPFLLFGLMVCILLLIRTGWAARSGRFGIITLLVMYWFLSAPTIATALEATLSCCYKPIQDPAGLGDIDAIIVLGGGSVTYRAGAMETNILSDAGVLRALEGVRLFNLLNKPLIIVSGGMDERTNRLTPESFPLRDLLLEQGVPADHILLESTSRDTYEQAINLEEIVRTQDIGGMVLVTSPTHMRRSLATFNAQGMDPIPGISLGHGETQVLTGILPDGDALKASQLVMREILATMYYALTGRFASP